MDLSTQYPELHPQVAARIIDGQAVIVLAERGEITVYNEVGSRVWELADGRRSARDIIDAIVAEYDVSPQQAEADVVRFIEELVADEALVLERD